MSLASLLGIKKKDAKQSPQPANKKSSKSSKVTKSVQQMLPYIAIYENGIAEVEKGSFSKSYLLSDVNFTTADEEQEVLFRSFCALLNAVSDCAIEITCINRPVDREEFKKKHLYPFAHDGYDAYRQEANDILLSNLSKNNSITSDKLLTLTIQAEDADAAAKQFIRIDATVIQGVRDIGGSVATPLGFSDRVKLLHSVYHLGENEEIDFSVEALQAAGITTKDIIAPDSMKVTKDFMEVGDKMFSTLFMATYPPTLTTNFIEELNELPFTSLVSIHLNAVAQDKAQKFIRTQIMNIDANIQAQQKRAAQRGYSTTLISPDVEMARNEALGLLEDVSAKNQRLFYATVVLTVIADDKEQLDERVKTAQTVARKHVCAFRKLGYQQDVGLAATLPMGLNKLSVTRLITTDIAGLFIPYSSESVSHERGFYYGINPISHSMILFDRTKSRNPNGVFLGTPGAGKSFAAKREMLNVFLATNANLYVIDPESEYSPMAELLGGEVIRIAPGGNVHVNPLDMDMGYADEDDPVTLKADFLCSLCEIIIGGRYGLTPVEKSIIDRCARLIYKPYIEYMHAHPDISCCPEQCPTLVDFYEMLRAQQEPEAQNIALSIEAYCIGSLSTFAHKTNVDTNNRFVVYDIRDIGSSMKELGLQVCLNAVWNKTIANSKTHKRTYFYIDEFYLLMQHDSSAQFLRQVFKRARKFSGVPTGITQNVEDLLQSVEARSVLNNCDFVMMLNQAPLDRVALADMYHISESMQQFVTNANPGHGLIYTGKTVVPFSDVYPRDTKSYAAMTTNPDDIKRLREAKAD